MNNIYEINYTDLGYYVLQHFTFVSYLSAALFLSILLSVICALITLMFDYFTVYSGSGTDYGDTQKRSAYECGFEPFNDARITFDVRFYLVGILFLIFDLEVLFLFPWTFALAKLPLFGFLAMLFFLVILIVGFVYEWKTGGLEW